MCGDACPAGFYSNFSLKSPFETSDNFVRVSKGG